MEEMQNTAPYVFVFYLFFIAAVLCLFGSFVFTSCKIDKLRAVWMCFLWSGVVSNVVVLAIVICVPQLLYMYHNVCNDIIVIYTSDWYHQAPRPRPSWGTVLSHKRLLLRLRQRRAGESTTKLPGPQVAFQPTLGQTAQASGCFPASVKN